MNITTYEEQEAHNAAAPPSPYHDHEHETHHTIENDNNNNTHHDDENDDDDDNSFDDKDQLITTDRNNHYHHNKITPPSTTATPTTTTTTSFTQPVYMIIAYAIFNITMSMSLSFIMAVLMPKQVIEMVGDEGKASKLGIIVMYAAILFSVSGPVTGFISDYVARKSRLPFIVLGTVVWISSILVRPSIVSWYVSVDPEEKSTRNQLFLLYTLVSAIGKMFYAVATTPLTALLPDFFPKEQYNSISAVVGCSNLTGAVLGIVIMGLFYDRIDTIWSCSVVSVLVIISMISLIPFQRSNNLDHRIKQAEERSLLRENGENSDDEENGENGQVRGGDNGDDNGDDDHFLREYFGVENSAQFEYMVPDQFATGHTGIIDTSSFIVSSFIKPFTHWNFSWVFITRFIMTLGNSSIKSFFLYFIRDTMKTGGTYKIFIWSGFPRTDEQAQSLFMGIAFVFSVLSSLSSGHMADMFGRRMIVFLSGILCSVAASFMIGSMDYTVFMFCGVLMGLGVGAYISVDLAMVNAVLPSEKERAKDLALWNISQNLPDLIASPLFGVIIDRGNQMFTDGQVNIKGFGYVIQYTICIILFLLTSFLIWFVDLPDDHGTLGLTRPRKWSNYRQSSPDAFVALTDSESEGEEDTPELQRQQQQQRQQSPRTAMTGTATEPEPSFLTVHPPVQIEMTFDGVNTLERHDDSNHSETLLQFD